MFIIKQDQNRRWTFVNHQFEFTTYGWLDSHLYITLTSTTLFMDKQQPSVDTFRICCRAWAVQTEWGGELLERNCEIFCSLHEPWTHYQESTECNLLTASAKNMNYTHAPADLSLMWHLPRPLMKLMKLARLHRTGEISMMRPCQFQ